MSQNSIDYPGEQVNPQNGKKPWIVHQPAYVGKNYFMVNYAERTVDCTRGRQNGGPVFRGQALGI